MALEPDGKAIREHLEVLFRRARQEVPYCLCEIAWSDPSGAVNSANSFPLTAAGLDDAAALAVRRNREGRNVYVGPNPRRPETAPWGRAKAEDVACAYFQFADIDQVDGIARLREALPLQYTMAVTTGRVPQPRVHPYWELEEKVANLDAWRSQQVAIAAYFGSDRVIDPGRVMRLAGTVSYPPQRKLAQGYQPELVTLRTVYDGEKRDPVSSKAMLHAYKWLRESNGAADGSAGFGPIPGSSDRWDTGRRDPRHYVHEIAAGRNLHNNARDLVAHLVNTGHRDWLIREFLTRLLLPVSDGGTLGQVDEFIRSARNKYAAAEPPESEDFEAAAPSGDTYEPLDFEQLAALPPVSYLISGLVTDYGLAIVYGDPASGKTFLVLDMALHLTHGMGWHGRDAQPAGVLYIAGEGARGIAKRIAAWRHHYGAGDAVAPFRVIPHALDLLTPADVQKLARTIDKLIGEGFPVTVIVIDTVARMMNGDENDARDMAKLVSACDALREKFSAAVIAIHHRGKDEGKGMRGSTALPGAADTIIEVERNENTMCVTVKKQKDDDEPEPFYLDMVQVPADKLGTQTSLVLKILESDNKKTGNGTKQRNPTKPEIDLIFDEIERGWNSNRPWSAAPQTRNEGRYLPRWITLNVNHVSYKDACDWVDHWLMNRCLKTIPADKHNKYSGLRVVMRPGTYTGT